MQTREQVRAFILSNFYVTEAEGLSDTDSLLDLGIVDSTGVLEVIAFLEETFGIHVEDSELVPANLDSIERLAAFVERKIALAA
jgi:acyl carrier protein